MNTNSNPTNPTNPTFNASLLQLESLEMEFKNTLTQYETAYANYLSLLKANQTNTTPTFMTVQNKAYWGNAGITDQSVSSLEQCQALCSANALCSGATFNPDKELCWTRSGYSNLSPGMSNDYAIVPELTFSLSQLQTLNQQLTNISNNINTALATIRPVAEKERELTQVKKQELIKTFDYLKKERLHIDNMLKENYSLDQENNNNTLLANQSNLMLMVFIIIAIILVALIVKTMVQMQT